MSFYILKFGGSSISTISRINHVAQIIANFKHKGHDIVVVTSAMQGVTNQLVEYARSFNIAEINREYDAIISCGESIASGILSLAVQANGLRAKSFNSWQIPIKASGNYSNASITDINTELLKTELSNNIIPIITGFQGLSNNNEILTLGRGGSDTTACALAYYLNTNECLIYTDVPGIFTADPRFVLNSKVIKTISYDEMLDLAKYGAKVMQYQSVNIAKQYQIKVRVLSSFYPDLPGTVIQQYAIHSNNIVGIAHSTDYVLLNTDIDIHKTVSKYNIIQISNNKYLVPKAYLSEVITTISNICFTINNDIGIVTIVGHSINNMAIKLNNILNTNNIKPEYISISDSSITYIVQLNKTEETLNILHNNTFD